jgi:hypothetical protein
MHVWQDAYHAADYVAKRARAVRGPIRDRLQDMLRHCEGAGNHRLPSLVKVERVAAGWPLSGSVFVRRQDCGTRFRLYLAGSKWRAEAVK